MANDEDGSNGIAGHSGLDPEVTDARRAEEWAENFEGVEEAKEEVNTAKADVASAMQSESGPQSADIGPSIDETPERNPGIHTIDSVTVEKESESSNPDIPYDLDVMDRVGEALGSVALHKGGNRAEIFDDIAGTVEEVDGHDELVNKLSEDYSSGRIDRMIGEEGVLRDSEVYSGDGNLTALGEDVSSMISDVEHYFQGLYGETVDEFNFDNSIESASINLSEEIAGPVNVPVKVGKGQEMEDWVNQAKAAAVTGISKKGSEGSNRLLALMNYVEDFGIDNEKMAEELGYGSAASLSATMSALKADRSGQGGYLDTDGEITKFGDFMVSKALELYESEKARVDKQSRAERLMEHTDYMDVSEIDRRKAEEVDEAILGLEPSDVDGFVDSLGTSDLVRMYSEEAEY